jgi:hypothetical protein
MRAIDVELARVARAAALACGLLLATAASAQSTWQMRGSDAAVSIVGENRTRLQGPRPLPVTLPAGQYDVHFGADAAGKPISLSFGVPEHAAVAVGVMQAGAVGSRGIPLDGDGWTETRGGGGAKGMLGGALHGSRGSEQLPRRGDVQGRRCFERLRCRRTLARRQTALSLRPGTTTRASCVSNASSAAT